MTRRRTKSSRNQMPPVFENYSTHPPTPQIFKSSSGHRPGRPPKNAAPLFHILKNTLPKTIIKIRKRPIWHAYISLLFFLFYVLPLHLSASTNSRFSLLLYKIPALRSLPPAAATLSDQPNVQLQLQQQKLMMNGFEEEEEEEEEEEALSLSDLPILGPHQPSDRDDDARQPEPEDFEFGSWAADDPLMCSADDVFFQGQILPLRPSVSSDTGLLLAACSHPNSQKSSRSGSRSDSMDRSSWGFSSSCSSSSNSNGSSSRRPAATSAYGGFYDHHPSPKPHLGGAHIRRSACRSGRGRSSWGLFRLGLVQTPEIELGELRRRRSGGGGGPRRGKDGNAPLNVGDEGAPKFRWGRGLSCKCSPAAVETVSSRIIVLRGKKGILEEGQGYNGKREISRRRTFEWLRQLSIAEAPVA